MKSREFLSSFIQESCPTSLEAVRLEISVLQEGEDSKNREIEMIFPRRAIVSFLLSDTCPVRRRWSCFIFFGENDRNVPEKPKRPTFSRTGRGADPQPLNWTEHLCPCVSFAAPTLGAHLKLLQWPHCQKQKLVNRPQGTSYALGIMAYGDLIGIVNSSSHSPIHKSRGEYRSKKHTGITEKSCCHLCTVRGQTRPVSRNDIIQHPPPFCWGGRLLSSKRCHEEYSERVEWPN